MNATAQAVLTSWRLPPGTALLLALTAAIYWRGFVRLHRQLPERFPAWRLAAFMGGLFTLLLALASPLDAFGGLLLSVHMIQHMLLMFAAPPLLLLGAPAIALLRGLPPSITKQALGPFLRWRALRSCGLALTHPLVGWAALTAVTWGWHLPGPYQLALRSPKWHATEHVSFVIAALLFWWPVVEPWPSVPWWPRWAMVPYLLLADVQNTAFCALFAFSERLIYPYYGAVPRLDGISAAADQMAAGAIMWVPTSLVFLVPAAAIILRLLSPRMVSADPAAAGRGLSRAMTPGVEWRPKRRPPLPLPARGRQRRPFDLLELPLLGVVLHWRGSRVIAQTMMLLAAAAVVADGLWGPQAMPPMNLAGVLPWTYWRAALVIGIAVAGNLFCFACPFTLPRAIARRMAGGWRWPRWLRSKWLAVILLVLFFCGYEVFDLWNRPRLTAWLIVGYFIAAFAVDAIFRGASFCKYVCPIGQFQFIQSTVSPLTVRARNLATCATCSTLDCIRGNQHQNGCELGLFIPHKAGDLDCTMCMDCVHACPHDNVAIGALIPTSDLIRDPMRAGLGRLSRRTDIAALALIVVFAAFAAAAAMVGPMVQWQQEVAQRLGLSSAKPVVGAMLFTALALIPPALAVGASALGRLISGVKMPLHRVAARFALALIPLGLSMWLAHFLIHLMSGLESAIPAVQRALGDLGAGWLGAPRWTAGPMANYPGIELCLLDAGLILSLYAAWRIARECVPGARRALGLMAPWAALAIALYAGGTWTLRQPMPMRGLMTMPMNSALLDPPGKGRRS